MNVLAFRAVLILGLFFAGPGGSLGISSLTKPRIKINLARLGWKTPVLESDRSFFRTFSIPKLEALDLGEKILFLNQDVLVAYHTVPESGTSKDWPSSHGVLEAFFLRSSDGSLLGKKQWLTSPRKSLSNHLDSEARIISVSNDRFLVHARGMLMLYKIDLTLLQERPLNPAGLNDLWDAQRVPGGR